MSTIPHRTRIRASRTLRPTLTTRTITTAPRSTTRDRRGSMSLPTNIMPTRRTTRSHTTMPPTTPTRS